MKKFIWLYRDPSVAVDGGASASIVQPLDTGAAAAAAAADKAAADKATADAAAASAGDKGVADKAAADKAVADKAVADAAKATSGFVIPDAYKDKPYLKGVDSQEKLFKMLDGAQELIGKKGVSKPVDGAPQAEWDAYFESLGRPKTAAEYVFEPVEGLQYDEKLTQGVKDLMHKNGVTSAQAKELQKGFDTLVAQIAKDKGLELKQLDQDFDKLAATAFGAERDRVLASSKALIDKLTSPNMKPYVAKLSNDSLVVLADIMNNVNKTYIKEDIAPGGGPNLGGMTPADRSAKGRELMASQAYNDPWHKDHAAVVKQVKELYASPAR